MQGSHSSAHVRCEGCGRSVLCAFDGPCLEHLELHGRGGEVAEHALRLKPLVPPAPARWQVEAALSGTHLFAQHDCGPKLAFEQRLSLRKGFGLITRPLDHRSLSGLSNEALVRLGLETLFCPMRGRLRLDGAVVLLLQRPLLLCLQLRQLLLQQPFGSLWRSRTEHGSMIGLVVGRQCRAQPPLWRCGSNAAGHSSCRMRHRGALRPK